MTTSRRRPPDAATLAGDGHAPRDGGRPQDRAAEAPPAPAERAVDPRAVRVGLSAAFGHVGLAPVIIEPTPTPIAPTSAVLGTGILGGIAEHPTVSAPEGREREPVLIDGEPVDARLDHLDPERAVLHAGDASGPIRVILESGEVAPGGRGVIRREVVIDGWRIEVEVESERRAALRDRARRGREESAHGGPTEVHAIIPGRIVSVSVAPGDAVVASQQLLVVEAMKMQNELRAPRDGTVTTVGVAPGDTIEIGDLLLVLE